MRRSRADHNSSDVVKAWRALGWYVQVVGPYGLGYDAIGFKGGRVVIAEIKNPKAKKSDRALTPNEVRVQSSLRWHGVHVFLFETVEDLAQLDREARSRYESRAESSPEHVVKD